MTKMEHQFLLISGLQTFTGKVPAAYANQKEFFFTSLQNVSENIIGKELGLTHKKAKKYLSKIGLRNMVKAEIDGKPVGFAWIAVINRK